MQNETITNEIGLKEQIKQLAETCNKFELDADAERIITIARVGYLFD